MGEEVLVLEERGIHFLGLDGVGTDAADVIFVVRKPSPHALPDQHLRPAGEADLFVAVEGDPLAPKSWLRQETGQCAPERLPGAAQAFGYRDQAIWRSLTQSTVRIGGPDKSFQSPVDFLSHEDVGLPRVRVVDADGFTTRLLDEAPLLGAQSDRRHGRFS